MKTKEEIKKFKQLFSKLYLLILPLNYIISFAFKYGINLLYNSMGDNLFTHGLNLMELNVVPLVPYLAITPIYYAILYTNKTSQKKEILSRVITINLFIILSTWLVVRLTEFHEPASTLPVIFGLSIYMCKYYIDRYNKTLKNKT